MSSMIKFKMTGLAELDKAVKTLPEKIQKRVLVGALRAGGRVIAKQAKARVPIKFGRLKKNIAVIAGKFERGTAIVYVHTKPKAWYSHMIEFGTKPHAVAKKSNTSSGKQTGKMHPGGKAHPYMRPAFDTTHKEVLDAIGQKLADGIIKEVAKL